MLQKDFNIYTNSLLDKTNINKKKCVITDTN